MSNLSDLLPAGGGAKVITATADGNLATGQTVILQSNGTVKAVEATAAGLGSEAVFESGSTTYSHVVYDSYNDKIVVFYSDASDSNKGKAAVGTVTGNSISWGTPVQFSTGTDVSYIGGTYDPDTYKVIVVYKDGANSNYGTANVGTVSGTSISFGTKVVYESASVFWNAATYETAADKVVVAYRDAGDSNKGKAIVGTVSGTSISFGSATDIDGGEANRIGITFDSTANKVLIIYQGTGIEIISGTVSGTSISFGVSGQLDSSGTGYPIGIAYNSTDDNFLVAWGDGGSSYLLTIQAGNTSGSGFAVGSAVTVSGVNVYYPWLAYDSGANIYNLVYNDASDSNKGKVVPVTVSGTTPSVGTAVVFNAASSDYITSVYNSSAKNTAIVYQDGGNSNYGTGIIWANAGSTSDNFAGITNQAINNSASGEVVVEGGVITNGSLLPAVVTPSVNGSQIIHNTDLTYYTEMAYDTANDKLVLAYMDRGSSGNDTVGKAVVATISGDSISLGTPVTFDSNIGSRHGICYDSNSGKIVIAYQDAGDSQKGKTLVGTVSGTSISFGSENTFLTQRSERVTCVFDSSVNKVLIVYRNQDNSNYGTAIAGTVSGTSMTFGSAVVWESTAADNFTGTYDTNQNASIIAYTTTSNGNKVAKFTVSSSSVIAGYGNNGYYTGGASTSAVSDISVAYDSTANRSIIAFSDGNNSSYGTATVADFSGGGVPTFGTPVVFNAAATGYVQIADDPVNGVTLIAYKDSGDGDDGTVLTATVSGTSLTYGSEVEFDPDIAFPWDLIRDPDGGKFVVAYLDEIGGSGGNYDGSLITITMTSSFPNLAIGSTYYVQDNGTLSTTSSSVTAGKAIANTTLLLKG